MALIRIAYKKSPLNSLLILISASRVVHTTSRRGFQNWPVDIFLSEFGYTYRSPNHVSYIVNGVRSHRTSQ